ncbi:GNAT family N-acetyltransferase [Vannielia litorea]|uniref:L-amino acid N-acyltransferase YncA n=1 Tax=Vannielia litorea TaxID=1217970 RepID=A0A1N6GL40_9RHOB|nr:GNAT family N-acetyltransferase [Vannielia litorea]SIO08201.1 L-amino acid N-acyltransferase YncA [Vannielia litorea]
MSVTFREARREDVPAVVALLADDMLGQGRETAELSAYHAAFDAMAEEGGNLLIVGEQAGEVVATYQLTFISGLSLAAARRAQVESVRVAGRLRGQGVGQRMFADVEARARAAGCSLVQLTMNASRADSRRFYEGLGFVPSHVGFKKSL